LRLFKLRFLFESFWQETNNRVDKISKYLIIEKLKFRFDANIVNYVKSL
jgi:hypothetical protein